MKRKLRSLTLFLLNGMVSFSILANAQTVDTGKRIFQLGQVTIIGAKDSLRSDKISSRTLNLYNRFTAN